MLTLIVFYFSTFLTRGLYDALPFVLFIYFNGPLSDHLSQSVNDVSEKAMESGRRREAYHDFGPVVADGVGLADGRAVEVEYPVERRDPRTRFDVAA